MSPPLARPFALTCPVRNPASHAPFAVNSTLTTCQEWSSK